MNNGNGVTFRDNGKFAAGEHLKFTWKINNFSKCPQKRNENIDSHIFGFAGSTWNLMLYPRGCQRVARIGYVSVYLRMVSFKRKNALRVNFKLSLQDVKGNDRYTIENQSVFQADWSFQGGSIVRRNILTGMKKKELLPKDTLTIVCEMTLVSGIASSSLTKRLEDAEKIDGPAQLTSTSPNICSSSSGSNLSTGRVKCYDVTLKAGEREFHVHKSKLKEKCPLFVSRHHLEENTTNEVDIPGIEDSVLNDFLLYIYTGGIAKQSVSSAAKLYVAARKYALPQLKTMCIQSILKNMSLDSICDVLLFADWSKNKDLENAAKLFMAKNINAVLTSGKWHDLSNKYPRIASTILRDMLLVKAYLKV